MRDGHYEFYEVVLVSSSDPQKEALNGLEGAIVGIAQEKDGPWGYTVHIYKRATSPDGSSFYFTEDELEPTGRRSPRSDLYSGRSLAVEVDAATGEGKIVNGQESGDSQVIPASPEEPPEDDGKKGGDCPLPPRLTH